MLGEDSLKKLEGVHADLIKVVERTDEICEVHFVITEGVRTMKRQRELLAAGATRTLKSRHITGHAVDVAPVIGGKLSWDWPPFHLIADAFKKAAEELKVPIVWGGDWRTFKDGPHFELDRKAYPA